jgi:DNA repair protein RadC
MTAQVQRAADALGITVHDHVIIGRSAEVSFHAEGYL